MWPKLRSSLRPDSGLPNMTAGASSELQCAKHVSSSNSSMPINVNEEYMKALRTKSFVDVCTKIHRHLRRSATHRTPAATTTPPHPPSKSTSMEEEGLEEGSTACTTPLTLTPTRSPRSTLSSPFSSYSHLQDCLLEAHDEEALLRTVRDPHLYALFVDYFDASLQAFNICCSLLGSVHQLLRDHRSIQRLLTRTIASSNSTSMDCADLASYVELQNPFANLTTVQFHRIHYLYKSLIRRLLLARDRIMRRARLVRLAKRASGVALVAACGVLATAVLVVAAHTGVVLAAAGGPVLVGPVSAWVRRRVVGGAPVRLARAGAEVDAAARGAYIVSRDMETMSRMVARLHDEVEHGKDVVRLFLRSREKWVLREVLEGGGGVGFVELLQELEEHVYWCLHTINRTRGLVAQEITAGVSPPPPVPTTASV